MQLHFNLSHDMLSFFHPIRDQLRGSPGFFPIPTVHRYHCLQRHRCEAEISPAMAEAKALAWLNDGKAVKAWLKDPAPWQREMRNRAAPVREKEVQRCGSGRCVWTSLCVVPGAL